jgi:hypothetical protein
MPVSAMSAVACPVVLTASEEIMRIAKSACEADQMLRGVGMRRSARTSGPRRSAHAELPSASM